MSTLTKLAGLVAGASTVAVLGVAFAQGQPPNPYVSNHAIGAGQQNLHMAPMGETGVLAYGNDIRTATITKQQDVAVVSEPAPAAQPEQPVAQAQEQSTVAMGAPAAQPEPAAQPMPAKHDRG